jgi:hypothetical protein
VQALYHCQQHIQLVGCLARAVFEENGLRSKGMESRGEALSARTLSARLENYFNSCAEGC